MTNSAAGVSENGLDFHEYDCFNRLLVTRTLSTELYQINQLDPDREYSGTFGNISKFEKIASDTGKLSRNLAY